MVSFKDSALSYAKAGFRVFPLAPNSKGKQVVSSWKKEATDNPIEIMNWWNINPNYNVAIATGNGLLVIDIDTKKGAKGLESREKYGKKLPTTMEIKTPSGGYHLYYYVEGEFKNRVNLYPGIDIRAENGYIVAPPSVINGKEYQIINNEPIASASQSVYEFLKGPKEQKIDAPLHIDNVINEGGRNDTLFRLASSLQAKGLSDNAILNAMWSENNEKCNPPLTKEEIQTIYKSVKDRYVKNTNPYNEIHFPEKELNLDVLSMDQVEEKEAQWLIKDFIPKGAITIVGGDGGVGKTFFWCDVIASLSSGKYTFFENENYGLIEKREPQKVMYFSSEDDMEITLRRRLRKNGACLENIVTIPISDERFKDIKYNSEFLEKLIEKHQPAVVVFDPLQGFIPGNINMGYRNAMRELLAPLIGLGEKYDTTIMIMCHTNKRENSFGRNRLSDSSDIWDIARSVFIIGHTGENDIRYLSHEKCNYGPLQETSLFVIDDDVITYRGSTKKKDKDFMTQKSYERKGKSAREEAKEFILDQLLANGGSMEAKELNEMAESIGHSKGTFDRAKTELVKNKEIKIDRKGSNKGSDIQKTIISLMAMKI